MNAILPFVLFASAATMTMAELAPSPSQELAKRELEEASQMEEYAGSLYAQARADGVDYRPMLKQAIRLDRKALASLFKMRFMGEGAEMHGSILLDLLTLWGDAAFAEALRSQSKEIRALVIGSMDHSWATPEWSSFPLTLGLSPTSVDERPKPDQQ